MLRVESPSQAPNLANRARGVKKCGGLGAHAEPLTVQIVRDMLRNVMVWGPMLNP